MVAIVLFLVGIGLILWAAERLTDGVVFSALLSHLSCCKLKIPSIT